MPGPSFSTPKSVLPSINKRRFTLSQANRSLPLVKRIVRDIVRTHDEALSMQAQVESMDDGKETAEIQTKLDAMVDRLRDFVGELSDVGCELKDYQTGLIDFVGQHQGRDVYLCWKLGEEKVNYWHELTTGFAGRKPVSLLDERF
jgi:hypothetical protein